MHAVEKGVTWSDSAFQWDLLLALQLVELLQHHSQ